MADQLYTLDEASIAKLAALVRRMAKTPFNDGSQPWQRGGRPTSGPRVTIRGQNTSAHNAPRRGLVAITSITYGAGAPLALFTRPSATFARNVAIARHPIAAGGTGELEIFENHFAEIACDGAPAAGEEWGQKEDSFLLHKSRPGFQIFCRTVDGYALAMQRRIEHLFGKASSSISKAVNGTLTIWTPDPATGLLAATGQTLTARALDAIPSGKLCKIEAYAGQWFAGRIEC